MTSRKSTNRALRAALVGAISAGSLLAATAPATAATEAQRAASAGPGCNLGCSTTVNDSPIVAMALFNYCVGGHSTGDWTSTRPTCSSGGAAQRSMNLWQGDHTPYNQDWDTLQVDAGWCYKVKFVVTALPDFTRTYDRRGKSTIWVKVENHVDAHILAQGSASCP